MKKSEIVIGHCYLINHFGALSTVRVDGLRNHVTYGSRDGVNKNMTQYNCTKLATGNSIIVKSAAKFRKEVDA